MSGRLGATCGLGSGRAAGEPPNTDRHQAHGTILAQAGEFNGQGAPRGLNGARIGEAQNPGPRARDEETQEWCLTNVSGFCNAQSALSRGARLVGMTELRGGVQETKAIAKQAGFAVSLSEPAEDSKCLAGIFFGGAEGKAVQVPCRPGWAERIAAAQIRLCARTICTVVCIYGHSNRGGRSDELVVGAPCRDGSRRHARHGRLQPV